MAATTDKETLIKELRGNDRVFQIDRDTFVVYTGLHPDDRRPFVRIGAGKTIPRGILKHIENVVLPEEDPLNVGMEIAWLDATIKEGEEHIRYVGSKDRVSQIYNFTGMQHIDDEDKRPVETAPYQPLRNKEQRKDRITTVFFETGNAVIQAGTSRIYDHQSSQRGRISLDKEYELLSRALNRRVKRFDEGEGEPRQKGFVWFGDAYSPDPARPFLYWNFEQSALALNPTIDHHQILFERVIDPDSIDMVISHQATAPGFVEALRRKNAEDRPVALHTSDEERFSILKRIYQRARMNYFSDGATLPFAKDVSFFTSRTGSHGCFAYRYGHGQSDDRLTQIVFPIGGRKESRAFDYIKAPHDLEIKLARNREELEPAQARLTLHVPAGVRESAYGAQRLSHAQYPLLADSVYKLHTALEPRGGADVVLNSFAGTPYAERARDFLFLNLGLEFTPELLSAQLDGWLREKPATAPALRNNVLQLFRYVESLPVFKEQYGEDERRKLERLQKKWRLDRLRYRDWLSLQGSGTEVQLLLSGGTRCYLFIKQIERELVAFRLPPSPGEIEQDRKAYARQIKAWTKTLDKSDDPPGYRQCLELMEKMYEEKLRMLEERHRFQDFLGEIGLTGAATANHRGPAGVVGGPGTPDNPIGVGDQFRILREGLGNWFADLGDSIRGRFGALLVVPFALLAVGALFF